MAATQMRLLLTLTVFVILSVTSCVRGFATCHLHEPKGDGSLKLRNSNPVVEIGYEEEFREIFCHAENFCSIIWSKNGQQVNESESVILSDHNQILRFTKLEATDAGIYTCEASNGQTTIERKVKLAVLSRDCNAEFNPINLQHHGCSNASVDNGGSATFNCEFFIGLDQKTEGYWYKVNKSADENDIFHRLLSMDELNNKTTFNVSHYLTGSVVENGEECNCADCKSVLGMSLKMTNILEDAFGTYMLYINNEGWTSQVLLELTHAPVILPPPLKPEDWHHYLTIPLFCLAVFGCILLLAWHQFKIDIKLKWKDFAAKREDSKDYDVYLSYDWTNEMDQSFAISLARRLEERGYKVFWEIHCLPGGVTDEDILEGLETSCRCVIIFSPEYLASRRNLDVIFAMDNVKNYRKEIIPIIYRDISSVIGDNRSALVDQILSMQCLRYDRIPSHPQSKVQKIVRSVFRTSYSEKSLHKELLLRLPPQGRSPAPGSLASDVNLVSAEVPCHVSSRESISQYQPSETVDSTVGDLSNGRLYPVAECSNADIPQIPCQSKLYPDISGICNGSEVSHV